MNKSKKKCRKKRERNTGTPFVLSGAKAGQELNYPIVWASERIIHQEWNCNARGTQVTPLTSGVKQNIICPELIGLEATDEYFFSPADCRGRESG